MSDDKTYKYSPAHIKSNSQINEKEHSENVKQKRHIPKSECMCAGRQLVWWKVTTKQSARGSLSLSFGFRIKGLYGMGGEGPITFSKAPNQTTNPAYLLLIIRVKDVIVPTQPTHTDT